MRKFRKRKNHKRWAALIVGACALLGGESFGVKPMNVLFIVIDDLRPEIGC
jgi:hypothetical protein